MTPQSICGHQAAAPQPHPRVPSISASIPSSGEAQQLPPYTSQLPATPGGHGEITAPSWCGVRGSDVCPGTGGWVEAVSQKHNKPLPHSLVHGTLGEVSALWGCASTPCGCGAARQKPARTCTSVSLLSHGLLPSQRNHVHPWRAAAQGGSPGPQWASEHAAGACTCVACGLQPQGWWSHHLQVFIH